MKKLIFVLILLIILGAAGFIAGWAQFSVPHGSYGIIRSKTHGIDPEIVREGEFRWLWYKLIPTNTIINVFAPKPVAKSFRINGSLPSGSVYAEIAGIQADFSWEFAGEFSFSIKPEAMPSLSQSENISSQEDLDRLGEDFARRIETLIQRRLFSLVEDENKMEAIYTAGTMPEITREIEASFANLEKISCNIRTVRYPDIRLYRTARDLYDGYLAYQKGYLQPGITQNAENRIGSRVRLDELEKIGDILNRYPVLLDFLGMERELGMSLFSSMD